MIRPLTLLLLTTGAFAPDASAKDAEKCFSPEQIPPENSDSDTKPAHPDRFEAETSDTKLGIDIFASIGLLVPAPHFREGVKSAFTSQVGIGKKTQYSSALTFRGAISYSIESKLDAKESDRSGSIEMSSLKLRIDAIMEETFLKPYFGLGVGHYTWEGSITRDSTSQKNSDSGSDVGFVILTGFEAYATGDFALTPEIIWERTEGDFSSNLLNILVSAR